MLKWVITEMPLMFCYMFCYRRRTASAHRWAAAGPPLKWLPEWLPVQWLPEWLPVQWLPEWLPVQWLPEWLPPQRVFQ